MDAAHFVMGAFLGVVWCFVRLLVKAPSGRQRFNVLGALNAITKEMVVVIHGLVILFSGALANMPRPWLARLFSALPRRARTPVAGEA